MRFRKRQQAQVENVADVLLRHMTRSERRAIAYVDSLGIVDEVTFSALAREAGRWTELLRARGVVPSGLVVVLAGRDRFWRPAILGVLRAGATAVLCPESSPLATDADLVVSARPRPELANVATPAELTAPNGAAAAPPHTPAEADAGIVVAAGRVAHTHRSLLAQADAGEHWLALREGERVVSTAPDGSVESLWLLLAAWRAGAEIVAFEDELEPVAQLDALRRVGPAAVWFADAEYAALAATAAPLPFELDSTRALVSDGAPEGASAFQSAFGGSVELVFGSPEAGVVATGPHGCDREADVLAPLPGIRVAVLDAEGNEVAAREVGDVAVGRDTPSLSADADPADDWFRLGARGAATAEGGFRLARGAAAVRAAARSTSNAVDAHARSTLVHAPAAVTIDDRRDARLAEQEREEAERRRRADAAARADERRRVEEAKERAKADERRLRAEEKERREAERAEERRRTDEAKRQERKAKEGAKTQERLRREKEKARGEAERAAAEARRREDERARKEAEETGAAERQRAKEAARAEHSEARRRADEEKHRAEDEKRRDKERRRDAKREQQEAREREKLEERRRREEEKAAERARAAAARKVNDAARNGSSELVQPAAQVEVERLAPDIHSVISAYGQKPGQPEAQTPNPD